VHRLFDTYLSFNLSAFYRTFDSNVFGDAPSPAPNRWDRIRVGEYRDMRYGGSVSFGSQLERLGNATAELLLEDVRLKSMENARDLEERHRLAIFRFGSIVDTKDSYPFPTTGVGLNLSYEFAFQGLGSDVGYNALRLMYESYSTIGGRLTFHPRITMGFADKTMPLSQQFRLGGRDSFFGLREDDQRGRELFLLNIEYRYLLPVRLLFSAYIRARYDLGTINTEPEEIKFSSLRHGVGVEVAFDTPVGAASFGAGESFYLSKNLPDNPIQQGPLLWYFTIGYQL
jgi:NTE family protein